MSLARKLPDPPKKRATPRPVACRGCSHGWAKHDGGFGVCRFDGCPCKRYVEDLAADIVNTVRWNHSKYLESIAEWLSDLRDRAARGDKGAGELADAITRMSGALGGDTAALTALGLGADATADEVKAAFRSKALTLHPDHAGGDGEAFKALVRARDAALAAVGGL